jgi:thiamine-phosphate pyrophosphorylase
MRLYALCDESLLRRYNVDIKGFVDIAKQKNAEIIQYRNKTDDKTFIKNRLIELRKLWDGFLIVNDNYELASFCDGVHLGQEDLSLIDNDKQKAIKILKEVIGSDKIIGLSTHNKEEVLEANELDLNYIGLGAYRATSTKTDISTILGDRLDEIAALSKHFVAAIGGVRESDVFKNVTYHVIGSGLFNES